MNEATVDLWIAALDLPLARLEAERRWLPHEALIRAERGATAQIRGRSLAGEVLRRKILARYLEWAPGEVGLLTGPSGKPQVSGAPHLHFSLSHSGGWLALAVSPLGRVGVDLELPRPIRQAQDLARRYFTPDEARRLAAAADDERDDLFLRLWTRTEALLKAMGRGLHYPRPEGDRLDAGWWVQQVAARDAGLPEGAWLTVAGEGDAPEGLRPLTFPPFEPR